jgi:hypothetical protein
LLKKNAEIELRDLGRQPLSEAELEALIGPRDYLLFLNPKNELYRSRNMKNDPPVARRSHQADGQKSQPDPPPHHPGRQKNGHRLRRRST